MANEQQLAPRGGAACRRLRDSSAPEGESRPSRATIANTTASSMSVNPLPHFRADADETVIESF
jgi:hypothetical protein